MDEKRCRICGQLRPMEAFYRAPGTKDGRRGECRSCFQQQRKDRFERDPSLGRAAVERAMRWASEHPERRRDARERAVAEGRYQQSARKSHLKRNYGLAPEEYDAMLAGQGGGCAICGRAPQAGKHLHVDHCHSTGAVRGLLCFRCNAGMGQFDDDPDRVLRLHAYLVHHLAQERRTGSQDAAAG